MAGIGAQFCNVFNSPDTSFTILCPYASATGLQFPTQWYDLSTPMATWQFMRFVFLGKLSTGSTRADIYAGGHVRQRKP